MDKHFLEFWGNALLNSAKRMEQLENLAKWVDQGMKGFEEMGSLFRTFYGLKGMPEESADDKKKWEKASDDFMTSFIDFLNVFGAVPKKQHLDLLKAYEYQKKTIAEQAQTIGRLKRKLGENGIHESGEGAASFAKLMEEQAAQFKKTLEAVGAFFQKQNDAKET